MNISVFFDLYSPLHESKDLGQITMGMIENGITSTIITVAKKELVDYKPKFPVISYELKEFYDKEFWINIDSDVIIAYPLQGALYSPMIDEMKSGGKKVLLKFDSDGLFHYPLQRRHFRIPLKERLNAQNLISELYWRLAPKQLKRKRHTTVAQETIRQLELCHAAIIESPDALSNLNYFLIAWERSDLIKKNHFIPNPVSPIYTNANLDKKENLAISYGRWDDYKQKNTQVMTQTVIEFLKLRPDYKFIIFGKGTELVNLFIQNAPRDIKIRINVLPFIEQPKILEFLTRAKIYFVPSRWESFSISSGEALCMGCSVVATPVEALRYLSMQGFSGSIAATFDKQAILAALLQDAFKWDTGCYDSRKIAEYWRTKLNRSTIAKEIAELVE